MKKFNFLSFCQQYDLKHRVNSNGLWIQVNCPSCNDTKFHGGFNVKHNFYNCWKCGYKSIFSLVSDLINVSKKDVYNIFEKFEGDIYLDIPGKSHSKNKEIKLPLGTGQLEQMHYSYLKKRRFDPFYIQDVYSLMGTFFTGKYSRRIVIPIFKNYQIVTYTSRDITGKSSFRYLACPEEDEVESISDVVYGLDEVRKSRWCVITEGIFDSWRLGYPSISIMGSNASERQIQQIIDCNFEYVYILLDNDDTGRKKARKIKDYLDAFGVNNKIVKLLKVKDPAEMKQSDADILMLKLEERFLHGE